MNIRSIVNAKDSKTFYANNNVETPTFDAFIINDDINNKKNSLEHTNAKKDFSYLTLLDEEADGMSNFKISSMEISSYKRNEYELFNGFDLIRLNMRYQISIKLDPMNCVSTKSLAEIFDFAYEKVGSFRSELTLSVFKNNQKYKYVNIEINGKPYKSYSLLWFIVDIINMYFTQKTPKDAKRLERLIDSIWLLYYTNKEYYRQLFILKKGNLTLFEHVNIMVTDTEHYKLSDDTRNKYLHDLKFFHDNKT